MIRTGLDVALLEERAGWGHERIGLVSHPAAVNRELVSSLDCLRAAGVQVSALFGMEHGFAGAAPDGQSVGDGRDPRTGLPVFSLYGPVQEPSGEMLAQVDRLVFDVQDVGARFYTFISTLFYVLRGAARQGCPVTVLDRPNPIGGLAVEGPTILPGHASFVGIAPMPIRHGLTMGELAVYFNQVHALGAQLSVVAMSGWRRAAWFDETGLPWAPTSPAMPWLSTATVYPGTCLLEGTNVSGGRGTALPFEQGGAPWIDGVDLAQALNDCGVPGVRFRPATFQPTASKYAGGICHGVQVHVTDREALQPVYMGVVLLSTLKRLYPGQFDWLASPQADGTQGFSVDRLAGGPHLRLALDAGVSPAEIRSGWAASEAAFRRERQPFTIYD